MDIDAIFHLHGKSEIHHCSSVLDKIGTVYIYIHYSGHEQ